MEVIKSFILGLVQGLTEFLPVSSSGHIEIFKEAAQIRFRGNGSMLAQAQYRSFITKNYNAVI